MPAPSAEHAIAMMLLLLKDIPALRSHVAAGEWRDGHRRVRDAAGTRLGLVGMGPIGQETGPPRHGIRHGGVGPVAPRG